MGDAFLGNNDNNVLWQHIFSSGIEPDNLLIVWIHRFYLEKTDQYVKDLPRHLVCKLHGYEKKKHTRNLSVRARHSSKQHKGQQQRQN